MASKTITKNLLKGLTCENCWFYHQLLGLCRKSPEKPKKLPKLKMCRNFDEVKPSQLGILRTLDITQRWDQMSQSVKLIEKLLKSKDKSWVSKLM